MSRGPYIIIEGPFHTFSVRSADPSGYRTRRRRNGFLLYRPNSSQSGDPSHAIFGVLLQKQTPSNRSVAFVPPLKQRMNYGQYVKLEGSSLKWRIELIMPEHYGLVTDLIHTSDDRDDEPPEQECDKHFKEFNMYRIWTKRFGYRDLVSGHDKCWVWTSKAHATARKGDVTPWVEQ